jgi:hypothetical protein
VGSGASYLIGDININQPPPGPGAVNPRRPFPTFGNIILESGYAHSTYHSLQAKLDKRFSSGLSLLSSYTWSHSLDNSINQEDNSSGPTQPQNALNSNAERSSSNIDVRQRFVTSSIYELPLGRGKRFLARSPVLARIASGWQVGGIFSATTGVPLTPLVSTNSTNSTGSIRPDRLGDGNLPSGARTVDRWFDRTAFAVPKPFVFGNSGRHVLRAPGLTNLDALIGRNFRITESKRLELRGEFYNFTNSVHFGKPALNIDLAQGGTITSTASPNRQIQLGLRFVY